MAFFVIHFALIAQDIENMMVVLSVDFTHCLIDVFWATDRFSSFMSYEFYVFSLDVYCARVFLYGCLHANVVVVVIVLST